jgi:hypothetical protein
MPMITDPATVLKPSIRAAVLLLARQMAPAVRRSLSVDDIVALTGVSRSQAYELLPRLLDACATLHRPAGRPPAATEHDASFFVACRVRDYLASHPGTVSGVGGRRHYSAAFRAFLVDLFAVQPAADLTIEQFATACGVPLGTIKDWIRLPVTNEADAPHATGDAADSAPPTEPAADEQQDPHDSDTAARPVSMEDLAGNPQVATLLHAWLQWKGSFSGFCSHAWEHLRLPWRRTFIARLLEAAGLRQPKRRKTPRPTWNRDTFRRLFPGAQWLGDGTTLAIRLRGHWHAFNLQATLDVDSNAVVGLQLGDVENAAAVLQSFLHGETTTGERSVALTLDGKPFNHTDKLADAAEPTIVVPATPGRGQAKASLEGFFGLFSQTAPPLHVDGDNERELARSVLYLLVLLWSWARNGKPRKRLAGRSPADHYRAAAPTEEERAAARAYAEELQRRHRRFCETRRRRADPARRQILKDALQRLGFDDHEDKLATDLARYSLNAILFGIALFETKRKQGTLTEVQDGERYLAGIIYNRDQAEQTEQLAERLLELRIQHNDLRLTPLVEELLAIHNTTEPGEQPRQLLQLALDAKPLIDFRFYATATATALEKLGPILARKLYPRLARQIAACFHLERARRDHLVSTLAQAAADAAA